jgi:hypothetical protein
VRTRRRRAWRQSSSWTAASRRAATPSITSNNKGKMSAIRNAKVPHAERKSWRQLRWPPGTTSSVQLRHARFVMRSQSSVFSVGRRRKMS